MSTPRFPLGRLVPAFTLLALLGPALPAQTPAPTPAGPESTPVQLDPFEVQATSDKSYGALNSNSITAFNTSLDKMPVSADVFDQAFMNDTAFTTVEQMLDFYSAGAGTASTAADLSAQNGQSMDRPSNSAFSVRGLAAPTALINGFFPAGTSGLTGGGITSNFDLERVDIVSGPQALLYGVSGAGGAVNFTTKQARLGVPSFGSDTFQVDQYGQKLEEFDYGTGTEKFAVRVAAVDQTLGARRVNIGGPMQGGYLQIAANPVRNTIIRVTVEQQTFDRLYQNIPQTFTALSTSNDARNGDNLRYLLATNQLQAAAGGAASGAGPIQGLTWDNVDSLAGDFDQEYRDYHRETATVDTTWTSWLTSELAAGYSVTTDARYSDTQSTFDAPNVAANPTGTFATVISTTVSAVLLEPNREKAARFSLLADNANLFGTTIHSKTVFGGDSSRTDGETVEVFYVQADSNWAPLLTPGTSYNGATPIPSLYVPEPHGPVEYYDFNPMSSRITVSGTNYVRAITNDTDAALISPSNPEGLTGHGHGDFRHSTDINDGLYAANYTDYFDGNLTSLVGARFGKAYFRNTVEGSATTQPSILTEAKADFVDIDAGVDGKVYGPLRAYAEVSESENPPTATAAGPLGEPLVVSKGLGEEVGLKASLAQPWNVSGSLAIYHTSSKNEETAFTSTIINDINPTGLNGQYGAPSDVVNVNRATNGGQLILTAAPANWRLRFSAAINQSTLGSTVSFSQVYNDQFHQDSAGDVTYADGAIVYVNPTFNSKGVIAAPAATAPAGYIPLTLAQMNNSASPYYANPEPITAQINPTSNVATVLKQTDPTNGSILTGAVGLPISKLQIAPSPTSPPPGTIIVDQAGNLVTGVPRFTLNFAAVYTIPDGPLKGVFGGPLGYLGWKTPLYYFFPQGAGAVSVPQALFSDPTEAVFTGLIGYTRKFRGFTLRTQINVNNIFNHYHVLILPSSVNGYLVPTTLTATFDQQPREYAWTTTIAF